MTKADKTTMTTATTTTSLCAHSLTNFVIMVVVTNFAIMLVVTNFVIMDMVVVPVDGDIQNAVVPIEFPLGSLLWKLYLTSLQKHLN